jgi:hypothetical protein
MKARVALAVSTLILAESATAQTVVGGREHLALETPEGWAMARTTAATLNLGPAPPADIAPWEIAISAEIGSIPHVDTADTRVGFGGTKFEDLNKSPVFGRGRLHLGLPAGFTAELAWSPPVEIDGVHPDNLYGIAVERPLYGTERWGLGARLFGQLGRAEGDITCSEEVAAREPGSPDNPFGCVAPSNDHIELDHGGAEIFASASLRDGRWQPFASFAVTRIDPAVQVNAPVFDFIDRSQLTTEGTLRTGTAGIAWTPSRRWRATAAFSYTPLDVRRPPDFNEESDDFWSFRIGLKWQFRKD